MMGFLEFSHECPIEGGEKQTCVGDCSSTLPTIIKTTLPQGNIMDLKKCHKFNKLKLFVTCFYNVFIWKSISGVLFWFGGIKFCGFKKYPATFIWKQWCYRYSTCKSFQCPFNFHSVTKFPKMNAKRIIINNRNVSKRKKSNAYPPSIKIITTNWWFTW